MGWIWCHHQKLAWFYLEMPSLSIRGQNRQRQRKVAWRQTQKSIKSSLLQSFALFRVLLLSKNESRIKRPHHFWRDSLSHGISKFYLVGDHRWLKWKMYQSGGQSSKTSCEFYKQGSSQSRRKLMQMDFGGKSRGGCLLHCLTDRGSGCKIEENPQDSQLQKKFHQPLL